MIYIYIYCYKTKMEIYKPMIRPVITYSSETWTLATKDGKKPTHFRKTNVKEDIWSS